MIHKRFHREEFECRCGCGYSVVDKELLDVLVDIRQTFGSPVIITSGCRCESYNASIGGAPKSKHVLGIAADIVVKGVRPELVYEYLDDKYSTRYGIGLYHREDTTGWVHVDVRLKKARWEG